MPDHSPAPTAAGHRAQLQARIRDMQFKALDIADGILDSLMTRRQESTPLPLTVARRQMANILGVPQLCHRARCRRAKTCDGEPAHCLSVAIPALPEGVLARILSVKAMRQRMRRR